jgi:NDP-sugar pyrophosphorylase family protein
MINTEIKCAVILAAGQGSRMNKQNNSNFSKPMVSVLNKPLVSFVIDAILNIGVKEIIIVKRDDDKTIEQIRSYYSDKDVQFTFVSDHVKKGSLNSFSFLNGIAVAPFLLVDCDLILNANELPKIVNEAIEKYEEDNSFFGFVSVVKNPSKEEVKMLRVEGGIATEFKKHGFKDGRIGGMIYLFFSNPFEHCEQIVKESTSFAFFFNSLINIEKFGVMEIDDLWDVDTLKEVELTENLLQGKHL